MAAPRVAAYPGPVKTPEGDAIEALRRAALDLHKSLLDALQAEYERAHGVIGSANDRFRLVSEHGAFTWLRPLTGLIVAFDELLEMPAVGAEDAAAARVEIEELLERDEAGFRVRYLALLQTEPSVVIAHSKVRQALTALPATRTADVARMRSVRARWKSPRRTPKRGPGPA
jgi:hypothetical protein